MVTEARPSIEFFRQSLTQQKDLVVAGEVSRSSENWAEWRMVFVAPKKPAYSLRGIQVVYNRFLKQGFKVCNSTYQGQDSLHLGDIEFDEGQIPQARRLLISVYPDEGLAREAYEWEAAWVERGSTFEQLRGKYRAEGRQEPYVGYVPNDVLREKWLKHQVNQIKSALTFWKRPAA